MNDLLESSSDCGPQSLKATPPPAIMPSVLITRSWHVRQNKLAIDIWYHTPRTIISWLVFKESLWASKCPSDVCTLQRKMPLIWFLYLVKAVLSKRQSQWRKCKHIHRKWVIYGTNQVIIVNYITDIDGCHQLDSISRMSIGPIG